MAPEQDCFVYLSAAQSSVIPLLFDFRSDDRAVLL